MSSFEDQATSLAATAGEIALLRGAIDEARLLKEAKATLVQTGHDNWNGGIDIYALMLEVPITTYADFEERRSEIEKAILDRVQQLIRGYGNVKIGEVVFSPVLVDRARPPATSRSTRIPTSTWPTARVPTVRDDSRAATAHRTDRAH